MKYIGQVEGAGQEVYKFYKDQNNNYWYKKFFRVENTLVSEEQYIFGREIKQIRWYKKYASN